MQSAFLERSSDSKVINCMLTTAIHGQIINLEYCVSPSSNDVAPASKIPSALMSNDCATTSSSSQLSTEPSSFQLGTAPRLSQQVTTPSFFQPALSSN